MDDGPGCPRLQTFTFSELGFLATFPAREASVILIDTLLSLRDALLCFFRVGKIMA